MADPKQTCFIISPIGDEGSDIRKRADQILKHVLKPAADACGFNAIRADEISEPGLITSQVIQHIIDDPLVIADLTGRNPNVFYELALRHAIRKPLIQIIQKNDRLPFDVAGMRTIPVDHTDLDSVEDAKSEIIKQIDAIMERKPEEIESPISVSLELQALRHSENPEERSFADFISAVTDLRSDIATIEKRLSNPEQLLPPAYLLELLGHQGKAPKGAVQAAHELMYRIREFSKFAEGAEQKGHLPKGTKSELDSILHILREIAYEIT
jgi:hypothetical protein